MRFLLALEFAFGAFLIVFIVWQIAFPLLCGKPPFPAFRTPPPDEKQKVKPRSKTI